MVLIGFSLFHLYVNLEAQQTQRRLIQTFRDTFTTWSDIILLYFNRAIWNILGNCVSTTIMNIIHDLTYC